MMSEKNYEFRRHLEIVHIPDRRDSKIKPAKNEILIEMGWSIVISKQATQLILNVAKDLQDYLMVSMNVSVLLRRVSDVASMAHANQKIIILATKEELPEFGDRLSLSRSYRTVCSRECLIVCGNDECGVGQGSYYLEDLMNLKEAPILPQTDMIRKPVFSPRMTHSGWGLDQFPDNYLNLIAHAGMDSIILFVNGVDHTRVGYQDFNNLIDRAAGFGLEVYFYSLIKSLKNPDDPDAEAYYDSTYGVIFKACPRAKGVILVGESCEFPSKDPHTTGALRTTGPDVIVPPAKPSPGWWPCYDYPKWLKMIKKIVRRYSPDAEIIFWTYNWALTPKQARLKLIRALPKDVTLLVTFGMPEQIKREGIINICVDYTITFEGPSKVFISEAKAAHEHGIRLYTMSNTGGLTWDNGVIPYQPVPFQWARRYTALLSAHTKYGLSGLMESHHYGWWPSFVSELAKWAYWNPGPSIEDISQAIALRDFGTKGASLALKAWHDWSEAIRDCVVTNEDQYGPFRIGPSYPLAFHPNLQKLRLPSAWHASIGNDIIITSYCPIEHACQSPGSSRIDIEICTLQKMAARWQSGIENLEKAVKAAPKRKRSAGQKQIALGRFMLNSVFTTIHVKRWWKLNQLLTIEPNPKKAHAILDEMVQLAEEEIANAQAAIPLVEMDSRLGWEPTMEYMTDSSHLQWKIAQVRSVLDYEIPNYRKSLEITNV